MRKLRTFLAAFWLALAVLAGQHVAALHGLAHATDRLASQKQLPPAQHCDECFFVATLSGAVAATGPVLPPIVAAALDPTSWSERVFSVARPVFFLSRAPPSLLR